MASPLRSRFARARRSVTLLVALAVGLMTLGSLSGCASRAVRHTIKKDNLIVVDLVRDVRLFTTEEHGFEHPAIISSARLRNILQAVEIEMQTEEGTIRQPAFHPAILSRVADALAAALEEAGPNEAIGVKAIRKKARLGVFDTKYLTTFLAHVKDDQLYLAIRRVDWQLPTGAEVTKTKDTLPEPIRDRRAMDFRVVTGEPIYFAGPQDLEIDWKNPVFQTAFRLPGSTDGRKRKREVLESSRVPREEFSVPDGDTLGIEELSPEQLRALADLEEDRTEGRITETAYQRQRRQLLRRRP